MEPRTSPQSYLVAIAALAAAAALLKVTNANLATTSVTLLLVVLLITGVTSRTSGAVAATAAALILNFFFLPPFLTLHISGVENWALFLIFILASLGTSAIVSFARREAAEARQRRSEIEAVYDLGVQLFSAESHGEQLNELSRRALVSVGAKNGSLFLVDGTDLRNTMTLGTPVSPTSELRSQHVVNKRERVVITRGEMVEAYIPLIPRDQVEGVLYAEGVIDPTVIESLGNLLALALDRQRFYAMQVDLAALHESDRAKTSVIQAVAHDLSTPLTALRIQIETLQRLLPDSPDEALETTANIADEAYRLQRRIRNLLTMARIEAGRYKTLPEPTPIADLFKLTRDSVQASLQRRAITVSIDERCSDVFVDPSLALEILTNLIENADAASPHDAAIELVALPGADSATMKLMVCDRGSGIEPHDQSAVGDEHGFGLGLHIANAFAAMSEGQLALQSRDGGGTIAALTLPAARSEAR